MATGKIISQVVTEGVMDMIHGGGHRIRRLIVDGFAITQANGTVYVFPWADGDGGESVIVIAEDVDVPEEMVQEAKLFFNTKNLLTHSMHALGCSEEAAKQRENVRTDKFRAWADAEHAAGREVTYDSQMFREN